MIALSWCCLMWGKLYEIMYSKELAGGKKFLIQIELKSKELAPNYHHLPTLINVEVNVSNSLLFNRKFCHTYFTKTVFIVCVGAS